jgi:hypothetical protein
MPDGDVMEDIVDKLGEDEITEESSKLFFFLWYLDKNNDYYPTEQHLSTMFHCKYF